MITHTLLSIPVEPGVSSARIEIHSGIYRYFPRVYGNLVQRSGDANGPVDVGVILVHPMSNFHGHFMLEPIAATGVPIIGLNTRYAGNDAAVIFESCLLDVGAAVRYARERLGWRKVILAGFSGGGPLVTMYQRQAQHPTITCTPAGDPPDITQAGLQPVDGLFLMATSRSRSDILTHCIDASIVDENHPDNRDPELDLYAAGRQPPFDRGWVAQYRAAQRARMDRIDEWVMSELPRLRSKGIMDRAFIVHGTVADPRLVDVTLDPSDRQPGSIYGDPRAANEATGPMGRYTSLCAWLSQWSPRYSKADGVENMRHVRVPVCIICQTADQGALMCDSEAMRDAAPEELMTYYAIPGANHYFVGQPDGPKKATDMFRAWIDKHVRPGTAQ
jgi:alpha/beta superfamily hydrolase